jgi:hypothetical protein
MTQKVILACMYGCAGITFHTAAHADNTIAAELHALSKVPAAIDVTVPIRLTSWLKPAGNCVSADIGSHWGLDGLKTRTKRQQ